MHEEYIVIFQTNLDYEKGEWVNGGMCYMSKRTFRTMEEALECKNLILEKAKKRNKTMVVNGIGITMEHDDSMEYKLAIREIKIRKRKVSEWEDA